MIKAPFGHKKNLNRKKFKPSFSSIGETTIGGAATKEELIARKENKDLVTKNFEATFFSTNHNELERKQENRRTFRETDSNQYKPRLSSIPENV